LEIGYDFVLVMTGIVKSVYQYRPYQDECHAGRATRYQQEQTRNVWRVASSYYTIIRGSI